MKTGKQSNKSYIYIASFLIPLFILVIAYMINGIYPGSEKDIFISDLGGQYIGFFSYLRNMGVGFNNIMYQTFGGLGGGYYGTWAYYTSDPLDLIVLLFDPLRLTDAIYYLTLIKISLCGVTFALYLKYGHIKSEDPLVIIISSVSYALMSFNIIYSMNLMWISGAIMLPLVILGIDNVLDRKRKELFILSLACSVIVNYYTAYMIVLFCVIYFIYRSIADAFDLKCFGQYCLELFSCGLLSALMSAWLWLPVFMDLSKGKLSEGAGVDYGLIRNPLLILRQFLPLSFAGISSKAVPPLYCGLLITVLAVIYFFSRKITVRRKAAALFVTVIFVLSLLFYSLDNVWHCFKMPNGFPGRYAFVISFFMITIFAESFEIVFASKFKNFSAPVRALVGLFVAADLIVNSAYGIRSLGDAPTIGGYSSYSDYRGFYERSEVCKALGFDYPERIASYIDYSHDDGFLNAYSSLDYYSSSYNYDVSAFFRSLGLNSVLHYTEDSGICPVTASVLNVDCAINYGDPNEYSLMFELFDPVYSADGFTVYRNPYPGSLGYIYDSDTYSDSVSGDVFSNMNHLYHDLVGAEVFIECGREEREVLTPRSDAEFSREITVYPEAGMHLFMYVSPDDYDNDAKTCKDYLYFGDFLMASYTNMPYRYAADLGISDGSVLTFTFESDKKDNEIYFYSFDKAGFEDSVNVLSDRGVRDVVYSSKGIDASVTAAKDCNLALFLPYETGYSISVDNKPVNYGSYAGSVLSIPVKAGTHEIHISYFTPGLKTACIISFTGIILFVIYEIFSIGKRRKAKI